MIRLTLEREKRGLSKAELARRAKMQPGDVGKIESGRAQPYRVQLVKLGRAMRMRVAESLTLGDDVGAEAEKAGPVCSKCRGEVRAEVAREQVSRGEHPLCDACFFDSRQTTVAELLERGGTNG